MAFRNRRRVRFADEMGQTLTHTIDQRRDDDVHTPGLETPTCHLRLRGPQPASVPGFHASVSNLKVRMENVTQRRDCRQLLLVTVLVANITYHKRVTVRITWSNWRSYEDVTGIENGPVSPSVDRFAVEIPVPKEVLRCEQIIAASPETSSYNTSNDTPVVAFAVRYDDTDSGMSFWDNNNGCNYQIEWLSVKQ